MSASAARWLARARWFVVAFWAVTAACAALALPTIREAQVGALGDLVPNDADAIEAERRSHELFGFPLLSRTLVVQRDADGMGLAAQARVARRAVALNRQEYPGLRRIAGALPVTNSFGAPPFAREPSTTAVTYLFFQPDVGRDERVRLAERLVDERIARLDDGSFAGVTGVLAARAAQSDAIADRLPLVEAATVFLVALVVGLHFRAVGAPLLTLVAVGISYLVSIRLIAWIGEQVGISVPSEVEPVIVVLLFGVVTDYSIFFLSRIRRRMADGEEPRVAVERGTAELLPIIVTAGLTVVAASASLAVAQLGFFQAFGPGLAMAVLIGLLVAITLGPALLAIVGRAAFWPRRPGVELRPADAAEETPTEQRGRPRRVGALAIATSHPVLTVVVCSVCLIAAASGLLQLEVGNPVIRGLPKDSAPKVAYRQASQGFAPGILSPTVVVVEREGITSDRRGLARLQALIAREPGIAAVVGPAEQPLRQELGAVLSRTGDAARYFVVFDADPLGARAIRRLKRLTARMPGLLAQAGLSRSQPLFAGDTALVAETIDKTAADIKRVGPTAVTIVFVILAVFLRALVAPLYLLAASIAALAAALGLATYFFQGAVGHSELTYFVPFAAAALLLSLGSDYNIFLVGRIWDEARRRPLREAVAVAGARAATAITTAGLVLAGSFALLALVPVRPFRELAFTVAAGLLIDAFLVRTLLVPALIVLVGERASWPSRRLGREHAAAADAARPA